jgi:hypothetical protein
MAIILCVVAPGQIWSHLGRIIDNTDFPDKKIQWLNGYILKPLELVNILTLLYKAVITSFVYILTAYMRQILKSNNNQRKLFNFISSYFNHNPNR